MIDCCNIKGDWSEERFDSTTALSGSNHNHIARTWSCKRSQAVAGSAELGPFFLVNAFLALEVVHMSTPL